MNSGNRSIVTAASIQMQAEIFEYGRHHTVGRLHSQYLSSPFEFESLLSMIEKMEEIFDTKGFPEAFLMPRTFGPPKSRTRKHEGAREDTMKEVRSARIMPELSTPKCTFEITVKFRQNATWQGQILWAEKNTRQNFRSVLEMLKLMDEALTDGEEPITWDNGS